MYALDLQVRSVLWGRFAQVGWVLQGKLEKRFMVWAPETMNLFSNFADRRLCYGDSALNPRTVCRCIIPPRSILLPIHARDLLDILASLQRADETSPLYGDYTRHSPAGAASFRLEYNVPYGVIRAEAADGSEYCEYSRSRRCFTLRSDGEDHPEEDRPFPASPPILGLLSPLDLPIWGGETSLYQPLATERLSPSRVKMTFGLREKAAEFGHVIIDLDDGIAEELLINGVHFVRTSAV